MPVVLRPQPGRGTTSAGPEASEHSKGLRFRPAAAALARFVHMADRPAAARCRTGLPHAREVVMLVLTMTFAWWLVAFPSPAAPAAHEPTAAAGGPATAAPEMQAPGASDARADVQSGAHDGRLAPLKIVTPEIVNAAERYLGVVMKQHAPIGTEQQITLDGRRYVLRLEWHYHPPGFVGAPSGWHHGITVYEVR
jgi:hypothetical protein